MTKPPGYLQTHRPINARIDDLLRRMTMPEKIAQLCAAIGGPFMDNCESVDGDFNPRKAARLFPHGVGHLSVALQTFTPRRSAEMANEIQAFAREKTRLGIPVQIDGEGLHGCVGIGATCFPQAIALAATWNPVLVERIAATIGAELRSRGMTQILSPVLDVTRDARAGRTEETYGEDTHLVSRMAVAFVKGVQSQRVAATPKHFVANFIGDGGRDSSAIQLSERALREIHLPPFAAVIREAGALSIMSAYHAIDGVPCSANHWLLTEVLRDEWGFAGKVVSDHCATEWMHTKHLTAHNMAETARQALESGMDTELPFALCFKHLPALVRAGRLSQATIDRAVRRVLYLKFWTGLFDDAPADPEQAVALANCVEHRELALLAARESVVLLKNNGLLPLEKKPGTIAVIGPNAAVGRVGGYSKPQAEAVSVLEGLTRTLPPGTRILYAEGCPVRSGDRRGFAAAVRIARRADVVVMVMGNSAETEGEGRDRSDLNLPGLQEELIDAVAAANPRVAVVLVGGSAITMKNWIAGVPAVLDAWYGGQEGGIAVAEILTGSVNPSGKLPLTFPQVTGQCPLYYNHQPSGRGYDYGDLRGNQPQFPFGHGLSYTSFAYGRMTVKRTGSGTRLRFDVAATITNTGATAGAEVVQLYIHDEVSRRSRPVKELKAFQRLELRPRQRKTVRFRLDWQDLAYLGDDLKPTLEAGHIKIMLGSSSEDIRLTWGTAYADDITLEHYEASAALPVQADPSQVPLPSKRLAFHAMPSTIFTELSHVHHNRDALIYLRSNVRMQAAGKGLLFCGADGPVRVWVNGKEALNLPEATSPVIRDQYHAKVIWRKGDNPIVYAVHSNGGRAWGVTTRCVRHWR